MLLLYPLFSSYGLSTTMAQQFVQSIGALVNATISKNGPTIASVLKASSVPSDLYAGYDWDSLSLFEQWWARWYMWVMLSAPLQETVEWNAKSIHHSNRYIGNPVLATGIMSFLLHEFFYFVSGCPILLLHLSLPVHHARRVSSKKITPLHLSHVGRRVGFPRKQWWNWQDEQADAADGKGIICARSVMLI